MITLPTSRPQRLYATMVGMEQQRRHVALIGLSGAGKSTAGPLIAAALDLPFIDTDREVERAAGLPVHRVFELLGESQFRALEATEVQRALTGPPSVISLGGGALLDEESASLAWERATVVWLQAEPHMLAQRLAAGADTEARPLLRGSDPAASLARLLAQRETVYASAHLHVDTTGRDPSEVSELVVGRVREYQ